MATGDRSKNIRQNVMSAVKDPSGLGEGQVEVVYDSINRVQRRIAEQAECLEERYDIILVSGQENYLFPPDFIRERLLTPVSSSIPIKRITMGELDRIRRSNADIDFTGSTGQEVHWYYKWNGQLGFLDSTGHAPSSTGTVALYYWRYPDPITEVVSDSVDPVIDNRWDSCLFYGAVADMTAEPKWWGMFEAELQRQLAVERTNQNEIGKIAVTSDYE